MAVKTMVRGEEGIISPPIPIIPDSDGGVPIEAIVSLNHTVTALVKAINSGLSMGDGSNGGQTGNIRNQWLAFMTPSNADEEFEVPHGLGRVPVGISTYFVDLAAVIYISSYGSWTNERLLLRCNVGTVSCIIQAV